MNMTREDLSFLCTPVYAACVGLMVKLGDAGFSDRVEDKIAWILGGIIAGLTPVVGPIIANGVQAALGRKTTTTEVVEDHPNAK